MNSIQHGLKHHHIFIFKCIKNTKHKYKFLGNGIFGIATKRENKS